MADFDPSDRLSRFDRADYGARQSIPVQRPLSKAPESSSPDAAPLPAGDEQITSDHLKSSGWSETEIQRILGGPPQSAEPESGKATSLAQTEAHLRSLGWTQSDIARLLVGPEKSHLTAEALFRQHAANTETDQAALVRAMALAGAQNVQVDRALLEGLDAEHLNPDKPADFEQLISQFAALPDVQKQRFLLLLDSQKGNKGQPTTPDGAPSKKGSGKTDGGTRKPASSLDEALPVVKGGIDLLSTALKGLLNSTKGGTAKKGKGSVAKTPTNPDADQSETEEPSDLDETDDSTKKSGNGDEDTVGPSYEEGESSESDEHMDLDSESAPD